MDLMDFSTQIKDPYGESLWWEYFESREKSIIISRHIHLNESWINTIIGNQSKKTAPSTPNHLRNFVPKQPIIHLQIRQLLKEAIRLCDNS